MPKVAYQGEPGAYSDRAVRALFPDAETLPCETIRLTFSRVTSGEVSMAVHYGLTDEEVAAGYVLTCQSVPKGEGVAVDYDA